MMTEEHANKTLIEKTTAERTLSSIESENLEMQRQVSVLLYNARARIKW